MFIAPYSFSPQSGNNLNVFHFHWLNGSNNVGHTTEHFSNYKNKLAMHTTWLNFNMAKMKSKRNPSLYDFISMTFWKNKTIGRKTRSVTARI